MEQYGIFRDKTRKPYPESNTLYAGAHAQNCQCSFCRVKKNKQSSGAGGG